MKQKTTKVILCICLRKIMDEWDKMNNKEWKDEKY